jgi:CRISPR-associated protein Csa5
MAQTNTSVLKEDLVSAVAASARVAVGLEMAYDIVDELARVPEKYPELFARLSRVVVKTLSDIEAALDKVKDDEEKKALERARRRLMRWGRLLESFIKRLEDIDDERRRAEEIRKFVALALAPDRLTVEVAEILERL